jgi:hypothetical protein
MSATGIHEIMDMAHKLCDTRDFFVQLVHMGIVDIKGDHATGRWILQEVGKGPGETYYNNFSQYEDVMEKQGGSGTLQSEVIITCFWILNHSMAKYSQHGVRLRSGFLMTGETKDTEHAQRVTIDVVGATCQPFIINSVHFRNFPFCPLCGFLSNYNEPCC